MNAVFAPQTVAAVSSPEAGVSPESRAGLGAASGGVRTVLRLEGAAALLGASYAYSALGGRWSVFALLFLVPDLSLLGYLVNPRFGAVAYNTAHSYLGPALLAALGAVFGAHEWWNVACIWAAHVSFDRLVGYGLKYASDFGDTHLGQVGRLGKERKPAL